MTTLTSPAPTVAVDRPPALPAARGPLSAAVLASLAVSASAERAAANPSGKTVELTAAGTHETGVFDASAAEIPAFDPATGRLFVVNAEKGAVDVLTVGEREG